MASRIINLRTSDIFVTSENRLARMSSSQAHLSPSHAWGKTEVRHFKGFQGWIHNSVIPTMHEYCGHRRDKTEDLLERVRYMPLMVLGVVLQQPPTREAPTSHHLLTYETKSSSETPVFCCNRKK